MEAFAGTDGEGLDTGVYLGICARDWRLFVFSEEVQEEKGEDDGDDGDDEACDG